MSGSAYHQGGKRFADDLRRIREAREVSLERIYESTRVSPHLLEQLEHNVLNHPLFNHAYLRPLLQQIADVLDLDPGTVLDCYEDACNDLYTNGLAVAYLDEDPLEPSDPTPPQPASSPVDEAVHPSEDDDTNAADLSNKTDNGGSGSRLWLGSVAAVVVTASLFWAGILFFPEDSPNPSTAVAIEQVVNDPVTIPVDSSALREVKILPQEMEEPTRPSLDDSIRVEVVASFDKVDPIRIRVDDDLRRPYWIEQADSMAFYVREQIILEERLDRIVLLVEGFEFPVDLETSDGPLIITRTDAVTFLEQQTRASLHDEASDYLADL